MNAHKLLKSLVLSSFLLVLFVRCENSNKIISAKEDNLCRVSLTYLRTNTSNLETLLREAGLGEVFDAHAQKGANKEMFSFGNDMWLVDEFEKQDNEADMLIQVENINSSPLNGQGQVDFKKLQKQWDTLLDKSPWVHNTLVLVPGAQTSLVKATELSYVQRVNNNLYTAMYMVKDVLIMMILKVVA